MARPHCIVCGKQVHLRHVKLEHGTLDICSGGDCSKKLIFESENGLPLLWASVSDMDEHEVMTPNEIKETHITAEDWIMACGDMSDLLWDDFFGDRFVELLKSGAECLEHLRIKKTVAKELPLLLGQIKDEDNKSYLDKRLKGEQP